VTRRSTRKSQPGFWKTLVARSTGELMVLAVTFTVCFSIIMTGTFVAIIVAIHPGADVSIWVTRVTGLLNTMIGLLAGFLAGRTDMRRGDTDQQLPTPPNHP
jgi:cytochrome c biogenesis protein CcdA